MTSAPTAVQIVDLGGFRWWLRDKGDLSSVDEVVLRRAYFTRVFQPEPGERWLDAGANIGAFAVVAAAAGAEVTSYEPWPESAALARVNLHENHLHAKVLERAVGLEKGIGRLGLNPGVQWRHSLLRQEGDSVAVRVDAFADAIRGMDAAKLDIEGAEVAILQHADDFGELRKLVFEWHFDWEPSTDVYLSVLDRLRGHFREVRGRKVPPGIDYGWFPPAALVRCWR